jgi:hypothetical protein
VGRKDVKRHVDLQLGPGEAAQRALSMVGESIYYSYGQGGIDPTDDNPGVLCDCTGFTSWCHGHDRWLAPKGVKPFWVATGSLSKPDGTHGRYRHVYAPAVGDLLVYPANPKRGVQYGHAGIVTSISPKMPAEWDPGNRACWQALYVTHCHSTGGKKRPAVSTESAWRLWGTKWGKPGGTSIVRSNVGEIPYG